mmetsp:Transcript_24791/g.41304  ORF Transcript_24791/g.41304 Transcript_24791/m.41304 type:complete len:647 (+) Transcript_24791:78-2018(+)
MLAISFSCALSLVVLQVHLSAISAGATTSSTNMFNVDNNIHHQRQIDDLSRTIKGRPLGSKLVLKRKPASSHCVRPHDYKNNCIQVDFTRFNKLISVHEIAHELLPEHLRHHFSLKEKPVVAHVQALMSMEEFVDAILPHGYIPAVVPEFKGITVGGSIQGLAAESTSFKFGLFHDTVLEFEAVLSDGRVLTCSPTANSDLFYALPGSFGSLAVCTSAKVLCIPAKPFVKITPESHSTHDLCTSHMQQLLEGQEEVQGDDGAALDQVNLAGEPIPKYDFLEGIGYAPEYFLSIAGTFSDGHETHRDTGEPIPLRQCSGWGNRWFYKLVQEEARVCRMDAAIFDLIIGTHSAAAADNLAAPATGTGMGSIFSNNNLFDPASLAPPTGSVASGSGTAGGDVTSTGSNGRIIGTGEFLLRTKDYLFRHDRGSFWMASYRIPEWIGTRMDPLLDSSNMFLLANLLPWVFPRHEIVLQDFMLPYDKVDSFITDMQSQLQIWPIWLLPMYNKFAATTGPGSTASSIGGDGDGDGGGGGATSSSEQVTGPADKKPIFSVSKEAISMGQHFCNVGAYGIPQSKYDFIPANKQLEETLFAHDGRKVYYSHAFYDRHRFYEQMYQGGRYFHLRSKYCPDGAFPEIFDKIITQNGKL